MSMKTWLKEYYPKPANKVSKKDALAHSLKKWTGLTQAAMKRHGVEYKFGDVRGKDSLEFSRVGAVPISIESCALCQHYYDDEISERPCMGCPLFESRGKVACYNITAFEGQDPFGAFALDTDAKPMIAALRKAIRWQAKKKPVIKSKP